MKRREVVLICDVCESETGVETRQVKVGTKEVESEVCGSCWPAEELNAIMRSGRRVGARPRLVS